LSTRADSGSTRWTDAGVQEWEGREENWQGWGAPMWWSHNGEADNLAMLQDAGFLVQSAERHTAYGETWLWVLAPSGEK
jgi:hypothetical protein